MIRLFKLLVIIFTILSIVEIALRIFWRPPFLDPRYKRNDLDWISKNVSLNRFGYRDSETEIKKVSGKIRIYALGDSYTYGWYINDVSDSYPSVLERISGVEVVNASRPGFNFEMTMNRLEGEGLAFNPDIVTLGINIQDLVFKEFPPHYVKNKFVRNLRVYWLVHGIWERKRVGELTLAEVKKAYTEGTEENKKAESALEKFSDVSDKIGAEAVLIVFPELDPANPNGVYRYSFFHEEIAKIAEKYGVTLIDLYDAFNAVPDKSQLVLNPNDSHPSVFANKIAGEEIARVLTEKKLIKGKIFSPVYYKKTVSPKDPLPDDLIGIVSLSPSNWVYFDIKNELSAQTLPLPSGESSEVSYLANAFKTAFAGKHGGWAGAKLEYHGLVAGGKGFIPRKLYGFDILGVDNIQVFWREGGAQQSETIPLDKLTVTRDEEKIIISGIKMKNPDFIRLTLDIAVSHLNLEKGKVIGTFHSELVNDPNEKFVSRANYYWQDNKQIAGVPASAGSDIEIPVLATGLKEGETYPEAEYLR